MQPKELSRVDKGNMIEILDGFPGQCRKAIEIAEKFKVEELKRRKFDKIAVFGMGGSGIAGHILKDFSEQRIKLPVFVVQGYGIPTFIDNKTLVFAISYSGNTEETIACTRKARKKGSAIVAITSGGILAKEVKSAILIPKGIPPRTALGYLFLPMLKVLEKLKIIKDTEKEIKEMISVAEKKSPYLKKEGKNLAKKLYGKIPAVYGSSGFESVALRFRTQLNENSKSFAHNNIFPELNHNESVGYKPLEKKLVFLVLRDSEEHPQVKKRIEVTKKILKKKSKVIEIKTCGKGMLARMFYLILAGDYISYYLALLNKVDPMPVQNITYLKKSIKEKKV